MQDYLYAGPGCLLNHILIIPTVAFVIHVLVTQAVQ